MLCSPVFADEVLTTVDEAVNQYKKGDYDGAASNLDFAVQLIKQKKSEALKEVFPDPFTGWEADPATSQVCLPAWSLSPEVDHPGPDPGPNQQRP